MTAPKWHGGVMPIEKMMRDLVQKMAQTIPEKDCEKFIEFMLNHLDIKALERGTLDTMLKQLTVREMNAPIKFYGSPEGQSVKKTFGEYMADIMPLIQQEMLKAVQRIIQAFNFTSYKWQVSEFS